MDYQKFIMIGNAVSDAKLQKSKKGDVTFATFSLGAKNSSERTSFFPVVVFGKLGEALGSKIAKGRKVFIDGHIETSDAGRFNVVAERVILGALPQAQKPVKKTETSK